MQRKTTCQKGSYIEHCSVSYQYTNNDIYTFNWYNVVDIRNAPNGTE